MSNQDVCQDQDQDQA